MALIRGLRGLCPCPICLVPNDKQADIVTLYPLRTSKDTLRIIKEADELQLQGEREELLKSYGLRYIKVIILIYNLRICLILFRMHSGV